MLVKHLNLLISALAIAVAGCSKVPSVSTSGTDADIGMDLPVENADVTDTRVSSDLKDVLTADFETDQSKSLSLILDSNQTRNWVDDTIIDQASVTDVLFGTTGFDGVGEGIQDWNITYALDGDGISARRYGFEGRVELFTQIARLNPDMVAVQRVELQIPVGSSMITLPSLGIGVAPNSTIFLFSKTDEVPSSVISAPFLRLDVRDLVPKFWRQGNNHVEDVFVQTVSSRNNTFTVDHIQTTIPNNQSNTLLQEQNLSNASLFYSYTVPGTTPDPRSAFVTCAIVGEDSIECARDLTNEIVTLNLQIVRWDPTIADVTHARVPFTLDENLVTIPVVPGGIIYHGMQGPMGLGVCQTNDPEDAVSQCAFAIDSLGGSISREMSGQQSFVDIQILENVSSEE